MTKKYALIRKSDKIVGARKERKWGMCYIYEIGTGTYIKGGFTSDKSIVEHNKESIEKIFPDEKYAILELEE